VSPLVAIRTAESKGVSLWVADGKLKGGPPAAVEALDPEVRRALAEHRERLVAAVRLREMHREMGLSEEDILFVEDAILDGKVKTVRLAVPAPALVL
jgi:hypothetical protein